MVSWLIYIGSDIQNLVHLKNDTLKKCHILGYTYYATHKVRPSGILSGLYRFRCPNLGTSKLMLSQVGGSLIPIRQVNSAVCPSTYLALGQCLANCDTFDLGGKGKLEIWRPYDRRLGN